MGMFDRISFQDANPVLSGFSAAQNLQKQALMNQYQSMVNQYQPKTMEEQLQALKLKNQLSGVELQYAPEKARADINEIIGKTGLYGAQANSANANARNTDFLTKNPLLNLTGVAGQIGALDYLQNNPNVMKNSAPGNVEQGTQIQPQPQNGGAPSDMSYWDRNPPKNPLQDLLSGNENQQAPPMQNIGGSRQPSAPNGEDENDLVGLLRKSIFSNLKRQNASADLTEQKANNYGFNILPVDQKKNILAKAGGLGIDPNEAMQRYNNGQTIEEMAKEKGFDPKNLPEAIYPATNSDISKIHFRQQALGELNTIQPILSEALAPYSQRINGYSPKQVAEAIGGDNPDSQAKFLAATGLQPEMSALRLKAMGGQVGIEAIREVQNASMGNIKTYQGLVNPEVYKKAQKYMEDWINLGAKKANSIGLNTEKAQNKDIGSNNYSNEDLQHTAAKYGISVEEVKKKLGI